MAVSGSGGDATGYCMTPLQGARGPVGSAPFWHAKGPRNESGAVASGYPRLVLEDQQKQRDGTHKTAQSHCPEDNNSSNQYAHRDLLVRNFLQLLQGVSNGTRIA